MADSSDIKPTPAADQTASSGLRLAEDETKMATNPLSSQSKETTNTTSVADSVKSAANSAAETATATATGVKDSVFSMFGGGAKKEKKVEEDDTTEASGSAKAKKDEDDEVGKLLANYYARILT